MSELDTGRVPLAELRQRLEAARTPRTRVRIARALLADRRRGAHALAEWALAKERARKAERARLCKLLVRQRRLLREGARFVAGVDEVGVGPLAGPVVAAAVVLPRDVELDLLHGLDDSKVVTRKTREALADQIRSQAVAVSIAEVSREELDRINIYQASLEAMRRAVIGLAVRPDHVLVDARTIPRIDHAQTALAHGDAIDASIAAASIVAKVHRDAIMRRLAERYPGYGFHRNMGYGTRRHLEALQRMGPTPVHRRSFAPVSQATARR